MAENSKPAAKRSKKSSSAFRTISEVAAELDLPQHVLRFWESKFLQIRPLKRGGGRRYYRPEDVVLLRRIRYLLYEDGYTIRGVQKLLRQSGAKALADVATPPDSADQNSTGSLENRAQLEAVLGELESLRDILRAGEG